MKYVFVEFNDGTLCEVKPEYIDTFCKNITTWFRVNSGNPFGHLWGFPEGFSEQHIRMWWIEEL